MFQPDVYQLVRRHFFLRRMRLVPRLQVKEQEHGVRIKVGQSIG